MHAAAGAGLAFTAKGGGSTELALKLILEISDGEPDFKGELEFKGLVLSFMSFATVSIDKADTSKDASQSSVNGNADGLDDLEDNKKDFKEEMNMKDLKEIWTIFESKKLPFWEN